MELRHLRYFRTVAEEGHITRAAERLSIQQPPLSLQIKALETELGVQLFRRLPRGVELTDAGSSFYKDICAILDNVEHASERAKRVARGEIGNIVIGYTSSVIANRSTRSAINAYRSNFPGVNLTLVEDGSAELLDAIIENRLDAALIRTNVTNSPSLKVVNLLEEPIVLASPEGWPLSQGDTPVEISQLINQPLVLHRRVGGASLYDSIIALFERYEQTPMIIQEAPRVGSALNLVAAGMGISLVPESMCSLHLEGVHYRPVVSDPPIQANIMLAYRKNEASQAIKLFINTARQMIKG